LLHLQGKTVVSFPLASRFLLFSISDSIG